MYSCNSLKINITQDIFFKNQFFPQYVSLQAAAFAPQLLSPCFIAYELQLLSPSAAATEDRAP